MSEEKNHRPPSLRAAFEAISDASQSGFPRIVEIGSLPNGEANLGLMFGGEKTPDDLDDLKRRIDKEGLLSATTRPTPLRRIVIR